MNVLMSMLVPLVWGPPSRPCRCQEQDQKPDGAEDWGEPRGDKR